MIAYEMSRKHIENTVTCHMLACCDMSRDMSRADFANEEVAGGPSVMPSQGAAAIETVEIEAGRKRER